MDKTYEPSTLEKHWYQTWEEKGYFEPQGNHLPYCIMLPPPNVTGSLHMGHAFQQTLMDILTRYHRMKGDNTLWQPGTDHAGIATQMVVERQLLEKGQKRTDLGREEFVKRIWDWKKTSGDTILRQMRRMGTSPSWTRERFTLDEGLSKAVQKVFIQLYDEGLIYRGKRLVNWDPVLNTAVSDLEVENHEEKGNLWHIRYPLEEGGFISIATTRPETLLGDVAVAVHPEDERYKKLIGKKIQLPLTDRLIPIIADEEVRPEFGTGCVKITPAHDFTDFAIGERHHLPKINIFNKDATLNTSVPKEYQGLDRFLARKKIVEDLTAKKLIEKIEPYTIQIPRGDRSGAILEPLLTDQWYVKVAPLAKPAIEAVEKKEIRFVPEHWEKTYFDWMNNIQDWCISRQLWWGHRIPAWYDQAHNIYVGESEADVRKKYQLSDKITLKQEEDVLDTWFSSALWPFSTLGWPEKTADLKTFYPTSVLVTGFDIIFFWVARMIMFGLKFTGKKPFEEVYIHGLIRDSQGQKMSKTKGNVLDPLDIIDGIDLDSLVKKRITGLMQPQMAKEITENTQKEYPNGIAAFGTDALRFTFCSLATTGRDIRFDLARVEGFRHFCNKLWNAARFVLMNTEDKAEDFTQEKRFSTPDLWIRSKWEQTKNELFEHLNQYRFDFFAQTLYEFTWNEFCDWYLELSKPVLNSTEADAAQKRGTRFTLLSILEELLRALHPIIPFITETIWQRVAPLLDIAGETIMLQPYPAEKPEDRKPAIDEEGEWIKAVILAIRNIRGEMNISPAKTIPIIIWQANDQDKERFTRNQPLLSFLAKLSGISYLDAAMGSSTGTSPEKPASERPASATALVNQMEILVPLEGLIDVTAELKRLQKEIGKLDSDLQKIKAKLDNPRFVERAPKAILEQDQARKKELEFAINQLGIRQQELEKISEKA